MEIPGPLGFLTNKWMFIGIGLAMFGAMLFSVFAGALQVGSGSGPMQANELEDVARNDLGTPVATQQAEAPASATPQVKRYTSAPAMSIDTGRRYLATIETSKGQIQIELDPSVAPESVNAFVFLAQDGYYSGTPFMQVATNQDGSKFTAQAGDPTETGLGTPGFNIRNEITNKPFVRGAVGMDSGQFFISFGDYPALTGKYSIIGQVVSGIDVLDRLNLQNPRQAGSSGDEVQSITITER